MRDAAANVLQAVEPVRIGDATARSHMSLRPSQHRRPAFATVSELASLLQARKITSLALTQMYLARLKRYDPKLHFVITLTEERALAQAKSRRRRNRRGQISRPAARHSLGRERSARRQRLSDHVGRGRIRASVLR